MINIFIPNSKGNGIKPGTVQHAILTQSMASDMVPGFCWDRHRPCMPPSSPRSRRAREQSREQFPSTRNFARDPCDGAIRRAARGDGSRGTPPPDLPELVRGQDRISFIYIGQAVVHREQNAITATDERGTVTSANQCLDGIVHAVIVALGRPPGLGFVHAGHVRSFVFAIAAILSRCARDIKNLLPPDAEPDDGLTGNSQTCSNFGTEVTAVSLPERLIPK